jgi:molybdate transport system substrate-binding protein
LQIKEGAPVDVFASADVKIVDDMVAGGHIIADTQAPYARGSIILWTLDSSPLKFEKVEDLLQEGVEHISIANPAHAPYGRAAQQALESAGIWDVLQPKIVTAESVSAAFQMAKTGNAEVGIVALSLGIVTKGGRYAIIPQELHKPINQGLGVVSDTQHEPEARAFAKYVNGPVGRPLMERYGFVLPDLAGTSR